MKGAEKRKKHKNGWWMEVFDVMFIMLLCFVILLTTMLMRGKVLVGLSSAGGTPAVLTAPTQKRLKQPYLCTKALP